MTIVIVTHELSVVEVLCSEVAIVEGGRIAEQFSLKGPSAERTTVLGQEIEALRERRTREALWDAQSSTPSVSPLNAAAAAQELHHV
ncbi:DL-methionine transporter ATP-binding subunit [compost metagenome]